MTCAYHVGQRLKYYSVHTFESDAVVHDVVNIGDYYRVTVRFKNGFTEDFKTKNLEGPKK